MKDNELLEILLDFNEWQTFECKRAAVQPFKILECISAFANSDGGTLVLGLEDPTKVSREKRLIGISENLDNISEFLKLISKEIEPPLRKYDVVELEIDNINSARDKLLIIDIGKSNDIHSLKNGDTFIRKGRQNTKIGSSEIIRLKYEKGTLKYEDELTEIVTLDDIDRALFLTYKKDTGSISENDWQFLKDNGISSKKENKFYLTTAGVLLFFRNPSVVLKSKTGVKISHYYGTEPSYSGEPNFVKRPFTIEGPLLYQIEKTLDYFREVVKSSPPKLKHSIFKPSFLIPEWAFQEAITNAVVHRNYSIQNDIQVRFFDDRVEIESPGTYPGHITVSNIRTERFARNPMILRTLNRFSAGPNLDIGEGVDRIFKVMNEEYLYDPVYSTPEQKPHSVLLVLLNQQKVEYWDTVSKYLDQHTRITNQKARTITGIEDTMKMSRLLKTWVIKGLLIQRSTGYKGSVYYSKPGAKIPKLPLTKVTENGRE